MPLTHCKEISIYVFPEKELRGLSPNVHIHVSVTDLYIPVIGPPIFLQQNMQNDRGTIQIAYRNMNVHIVEVLPSSVSSCRKKNLIYRLIRNQKASCVARVHIQKELISDLNRFCKRDKACN